MKKIFLFLFLCSSLATLAQNEVAEDTTAQKIIVEKGKPNGIKTEIKIGKEGGILASSDGKVELIVPAGVVSKKTTFSIQPINNTSPNRDGGSYRLEPSGTQFLQPVKLVFHYTKNDDENDSMQLLKGIAIQDDAGHWSMLKNFIIDTAAKTLSGNVEHFCDLAFIAAVKLEAKFHRVFVGSFTPVDLYVDLPYELAEQKNRYHINWYVNGIQNGNSLVGRINQHQSPSWIVFEDVASRAMETRRYQAPAIVPDNNPVIITAVIEGLNFEINGIKFNHLTKNEKILVYDKAYEIEYTNSYRDMFEEVFDTARFVIILNGNKSKVTDIYNAPYFNEFFDEGDCKVKWLNKDVCTGPIHVVGAKMIKIAPPSNNPDERLVDIDFIWTRAILPVLKITCTKFSPPKIPSFPLQAFPQHIQFKDNGKKQTYIDKSNGLFGEAGFEIHIRPIIVNEE